MPELTVLQLASIDGRAYIAEIKSRLRDDAAWVILLDPALLERTRWGLNRIINSLDEQKARVVESGTGDREWLNRVDGLRRFAKRRLDRMTLDNPRIESNTKQTRAWRAFSARLARVLEDYDPTALEGIQSPHGGLSAAEWLAAREEKKEMAR